MEFYLKTEFWFVVVFTVFCAGLLLRMLFPMSDRKKLPGPWGLPILGYSPFLGRKMNKTITALAKHYGDVFQLSIGTRKVVVVNGQRAIREALLNKGTDFAGRPNFYSYSLVPNFGLSDYSPAYRAHKQLSQKAFHKFTRERRTELIQVAHKAVCAFLKTIKETSGQPFDPKQILSQCACMIMGYLCYGHFFNADSEEVATILSNASDFGNAVAFGVLCDYIPEAKFLFGRKVKKFKVLMENIIGYSNELASYHIDNYDGENMRDISDMYRKASEYMSEAEKKVLKFDNCMLKDTVASLFGAGFGTIAATLCFSIFLMAYHPEVQVKVQEEVDRVIGRENFPDVDDVNDMPYTMAVINEIYRYHSMSAFAFTHSTTCDTELDGYFIAKGTPVMFNLWSAHRDATVFTDPDKFLPDRFLTSDSKLNPNMVNYIIPYGLSHRRCAGEEIARMEINIFFLTLLQRCKIIALPKHRLDPEDYKMTLGIILNPFKVNFESRYSGAFDVDA